MRGFVDLFRTLNIQHSTRHGGQVSDVQRLYKYTDGPPVHLKGSPVRAVPGAGWVSALQAKRGGLKVRSNDPWIRADLQPAEHLAFTLIPDRALHGLGYLSCGLLARIFGVSR